MAKAKFTISVEMEERWVDHFLSMLHWMESCGNLGHSSVVAFYADGDGDFRPKFEFGTNYTNKEGIWSKDVDKMPKIEVMYDAG